VSEVWRPQSRHSNKRGRVLSAWLFWIFSG
jgi:hypothetical protein